MSDNKDSQNGKGDPFSQLTDMESTVRIDFGANQNVFSTAENPSSIDFEQTLDGLTDIDDILKNDEFDDHDDEPTVSFSTDEINFDEIDAGINSLSDDFSETEKAEDENLDDLDQILESENESDSAFADRTITLDAFDDDEEPATKTAASDKDFDDWPLLDNEDDEQPAADPQLDYSEAFDLSDVTNDSEEATDAEDKLPVIELTEEMLDEPDESTSDGMVSDELGRLSHVSDDTDDSTKDREEDEDLPKGSLDSIAETPGLTTTETNILVGATTAIHEIAEEEKKMHEAEAMKEPAIEYPAAPEETGSSSSSLPAMLALLGIAAGGFGAWMAWDATNRVADLETQIRNLQAGKESTGNRQSIADIQQRLTKVERRLTGTPTLEAAATLGEGTIDASADTSTEAEITAAQAMSVVKDDKPTANAITPETKMAQAQVTGDWVVNLSSHVKESAATQEKARLIKMGLNAEVHSATIKNKVWYRVQIIGFATKNEAKAQLRDIQQRSGIQGAWVGKR